jgi:hypothetical protein
LQQQDQQQPSSGSATTTASAAEPLGAEEMAPPKKGRGRPRLNQT